MSVTAARKLLAAPVASGGFDPLSYGSPVHAFWADDPLWSNPGDGNAVTTWRNAGSNGTAATGPAAGKYPLFDEVTTTLNDRGSVVFDGSNDYLRILAAAASISQPLTMTVAFYIPNTSNDEYLVDGDGTRCIGVSRSTGTRLEMYAGVNFSVTSPTFTTATITVAHFVFNGASSVMRMNGTSRTVTTSPGTAGLTGLIIGSGDRYSSTVASASSIGFVAVYGSNITGESWFSEFDSGLRSYYGVA